jgi:hypothetical protein
MPSIPFACHCRLQPGRTLASQAPERLDKFIDLLPLIDQIARGKCITDTV